MVRYSSQAGLLREVVHPRPDQSEAEPGIRSIPSTTYFLITARLPSADRSTTHVCRASIPSHLLFASGGFQTFACQLTTSLTSASLPRGLMSSDFMVWTSSKKRWVTLWYQRLHSSTP